jgi:hypothetical protein
VAGKDGGTEFWQIGPMPAKVGVTLATTVTVAEPVATLEQRFRFASVTLTRLYTIDPMAVVGTVMVALLPDVVVNVWFAPPLIL